jgi:hypothetical protein
VPCPRVGRAPDVRETCGWQLVLGMKRRRRADLRCGHALRGDGKKAKPCPVGVSAGPVDSVDAQPPQTVRCPRLVEAHERPVPAAACDAVTCVEHDPIGDRDRPHFLLIGVTLRLREREVDAALVPRQRSGPFHLHDQLLHAEPGNHHVRVVHLVVDLGKTPVQDDGEQVFGDVLGDLFRRGAEPFLLGEPFLSLGEESGPARVHPVLAAPVRGQGGHRWWYVRCAHLESYTPAKTPPSPSLRLCTHTATFGRGADPQPAGPPALARPRTGPNPAPAATPPTRPGGWRGSCGRCRSPGSARPGRSSSGRRPARTGSGGCRPSPSGGRRWP